MEFDCELRHAVSDGGVVAVLVERATKGAAQVVVPHSENGPEPLCACWRTDAVETLQAAFERGVRKVTQGIALLRAEVLDERDWKRFDNAGRLFWNMNTAADYEEARRVAEAKRAREMADKNDISSGVAAMETGGARGPSGSAKTGSQGQGGPRENFFEFRDVNKSFDDNDVLKNVTFT